MALEIECNYPICLEHFSHCLLLRNFVYHHALIISSCCCTATNWNDRIDETKQKKHNITKNKSNSNSILVMINFLWATGMCWLLVTDLWLSPTLLLDVYGYSSALDWKKAPSSWLKMLLSTLSKEPFCNPVGNPVYTLYLSPLCITNINADISWSNS